MPLTEWIATFRDILVPISSKVQIAPEKGTAWPTRMKAYGTSKRREALSDSVTYLVTLLYQPSLSCGSQAFTYFLHDALVRCMYAPR